MATGHLFYLFCFVIILGFPKGGGLSRRLPQVKKCRMCVMRELCDSAMKDVAQQKAGNANTLRVPVSVHANFVVTLKCIVYPSHWKVGYTRSRLVSKEIRKYIILCNLLVFLKFL